MEEEYRISMDVFGGPLDLLLYLVQKAEVDIFDLNISEVVDQYISYVEMLKDIDIDAAGEFVAMAARLIEIKSRMLLPRPETTETEEEIFDPRSELVKELLEYREFKEKALALEEKLKNQNLKFPSSGLKLDGEVQEQEVEMESISVWDIMLVFQKVTNDLGVKFIKKKVYPSRPISDYIHGLLEKVSSAPGGACTFLSVFEDSTDIATMIGLFLAILECAKEKSIRVYQEHHLGEIYLVYIPENERDTDSVQPQKQQETQQPDNPEQPQIEEEIIKEKTVKNEISELPSELPSVETNDKQDIEAPL
ncbi:MAG: segregation/condensation protein A [Planctomycetota bacterium]